ncbi:hypothetical protein BT96DRAFT_1006383 [Gymnopus androsaceus JB14]|uniref:Uncharacterized protein n=1 Tax=Gymnopus androsaceus JB14 TaxID=1447944 RepID=A0A6A4GKA0_9AGAR|nr:hypothetical protein BT96DRAFT_1006383 [Gymnopus androsaceus JB14]
MYYRHSEDSKRAWDKGELIRYIRISSKQEDFAKIWRWFENVFEEISNLDEHPKALNPRSPCTDKDDPIHVLKLTHNPLWDNVDFGPLWQELGEVWEEHGRGTPNLCFLTSFAKPTSMGYQLNKNNRDIFKAFHSKIAAIV